MKNTPLILGILAATAIGANAAVIVQTGHIDNGPTGPAASFPKNTIVPINQFNSSLGTLVSVTLQIAATASAQLEGENRSSGTATLTANLSGSVTGNFATGLSAAAITSATPAAVDVTATDGVDWSGPDYHDFGTVTDTDSNQLTTTTNLGAYIGGGSINLTVNDQQVWGVSGSGNGVTRVTDSYSDTDWTVTYTYNPVPEPTAMIPLLGLIGLGFFARRRK